ncbi:hypothetical protein KBI52_21410 [Microvirga sp. HBU67558]|uniref:hypothetical protein n=1 Tax=Microvirga TaxID=186650 RepID=UPI001B394457|nr:MULTISPECIES: hypothetical protein [unclassified Microvirga]MBQ0822748.1 hypothetical protein [Microvirga sp. HBU67558]
MPRFQQLAEGERPADPEKFILIEVIREPAIGYFYRVTGKGLGPDYQGSSGSMDCTLDKARGRARDLAQAAKVPVIYLSSGIAAMER